MAEKIAKLEADIAALKASLANASPEVRQRADAIMQQLLVASGAVSPNVAPNTQAYDQSTSPRGGGAPAANLF